jgi:hypothetical protein
MCKGEGKKSGQANPPVFGGSTMRFREWQCDVQVARYPNGRTGLLLVDPKTGESVAVATVNLPDEDLEPGQVFIKDYSENSGMLEALEKAGIVKATGEVGHSGFVQLPKATLLGDFQKLLDGKTKAPSVEKTKDKGIER